MKKLVGSFLCASLLIVGATQAQAAMLTEWTYTLTNAYFTAYDGTPLGNSTTFDPNTPEHIAWSSAKYFNDATMNDAEGATGTLTLVPGTNGEASASLSQSNVLSHGTKDKDPVTGMEHSELIGLAFEYSVRSVENPSVFMKHTYTIQLQTFYDAATGIEYIFYAPGDVSGTGATAITHDGYKYGLTGIGLFVDGRALTGVESSPGYVGWTINEDTRTYTYDKYVVGATNNEITGTKANFGVFDIDGYFSITATPVGPEPTPEPATMLLTGLGLAGMGFLKRRRNKA